MFPWSIAAAFHYRRCSLYGVFEAELLGKTHTVDPSLGVAIEVKGASFTWDSSPPDKVEGKPGKEDTSRGRMMQPSKSRAEGPLLLQPRRNRRNKKGDGVFKVRD